MIAGLKDQVRIAAATKSPRFLAQIFAQFIGQFYSRSDFDRLAREIFSEMSSEKASEFQDSLNRRLRAANNAPVNWGGR